MLGLNPPIGHAVAVIQHPSHEQPSSTDRIHALLDRIAAPPKTDQHASSPSSVRADANAERGTMSPYPRVVKLTKAKYNRSAPGVAPTKAWARDKIATLDANRASIKRTRH